MNRGRRRPSFCSHEWLIIYSALATLRYGKAGCQRRIVVIVYRARSTWVALVSRRLLPILGRLRRLRRASRKYGKKKGHLRGGLVPWGLGNRGALLQSPLGAGQGGGTSRAETLSPPLQRTCGRAPRTDLGVSTYGASLHGDRSLVLYDRPERGCWGGPRFQRSRPGIG